MHYGILQLKNNNDRLIGSGETADSAEGERENSQAKGPDHDDTL